MPSCLLSFCAAVLALLAPVQGEKPAVPSPEELAKMSVDDILALADRIAWDFVPARALCEEAVRREPDNPVAWFKRGRHRAWDDEENKAADLARAGELFRAQLKAHPDDEALLRRIFEFEYFDIVLEHDPDHLEALLARQVQEVFKAVDELRAPDFTYYQRAFRILERWERPAARARVMEELGDTGSGDYGANASLFLCDRLLEWDPEDVEALILRSELHQYVHIDDSLDDEAYAAAEQRANQRGEEDRQRAMALLDERIEKDPRSAALRLQRFAFSLDDAQCLADATALIEIAPADSAAWVRRGGVLRRGERLDEALSDYTKAIELDPGNKEALLGRANLLGNDKAAFAAAIEDLNRLIALDPTDHRFYGQRAAYCWTLAEQTSNDELKFQAIADYLKLRKLGQAPSESSRRIASMGTELAARDCAAAIANLTRMIAMDPTCVELFLERADVYGTCERKMERLADLDVALQLRPGDDALVDRKWDTYEIGALKLPDDEPLLEVALEDATRMLARQPEREVTWLVRRGTVYTQQRREELALADFTRVIELDPESAESWSARGRCWLSFNRWESSIPDLTKAIEIKPTDTNLRWDRAVAYEATGSLGPAIEDLEAILLEYPNGRQEQEMLTWIRTRLKDWDRLIADATRRIEEDPKDSNRYMDRARFYVSNQDLAKAVEDYAKALELAPRDFDVMFALANAYERMGEPDKALAEWDRAAGMTTFLEEPRIRAAAHRLRRGEIALALAEYTVLIEQHPKEAQHLRKRAECHRWLNDLDSAFADYSSAVEIDPSDKLSWEARGWISLERKDYDRALEDFRRFRDYDWSHRGIEIVYEARGVKDWERIELDAALASDPTNAEAASRRGYLKWMDKDLSGACEDLTVAIEARPEVTKYRLQRMNVYRDRDMPGLALADATAAIELNPRDGSPLRERAWLRWKQGDYDGALEDLARAVEVDPGSPINHSELERFKAAHFEIQWMTMNNSGVRCYDQRDWSGAIQYFTEALALNPAHKAVACNRGLALLCSGDTDEARAQFESVLARDPSFEPATDGLRQVAEKESFERESARIAAVRAAESRGSSCAWCGGKGVVTYKGTTSVYQVSTRNRLDPGIGWDLVTTTEPERTVKCSACQ